MKFFLISLLLAVCTPAWALNYSQVPIVSAASMATNVTSTALNICNIQTGSIQAIWTGTPTGTLVVNVSDDIVSNPASVVNWSTYTGSSTSISGAAGNVMINLSNSGFCWVELVYTSASGSGTLNANAVLKTN